MIILGIDPGTTRIGYGAIKLEKGVLTHVSSGILPISKQHTHPLSVIHKELLRIISEVKPDRVGVEKLFFAKNKKTALAVAEARGVIIHTIASENIPIYECTPNEVKVAVTGNGTANKQAVAKMVSSILRTPLTHLVDDATDALAIAITCINTRIEG